MTREEEIKQTARKYFGDYLDGLKGEVLTVQQTFEDAAKWADEHPNLYNDEKYHTVKVSCLDELNRKAELYDVFLDKACEWLKSNMYEGTCEQILSKKPYPFMRDFINEFKQAMEGGAE